MRQNGHSLAKSGGAAWRRGLALACLAIAMAAPAQAQDAPLPSVNDYRLPSGTSTPRARPAGPVDPADPAAAAPRVVRPAEPEPSAAAPSASPSPSASAPAAARPSPAARPAATTAAAPAATSARPAAAQPAPEAAPASAAPQIAASPAPAATVETPIATAPERQDRSPAAVPSAPPVQWNVHSAREAVSGMPAWLIGLAFMGGAVLALMAQAAWRRRRQARLAKQAELESWESAEVTAPVPEAPALPVAPVTPVVAPVTAPVAPARNAEPLPELDLITVLSEPNAPAPTPAQPVQPPSRPELNLLVNPLEVELAARRMSATLMNAVLNYELIVRNTGSVAIGPVIVGGDMIGAHASLPDRAQLELSGNAITPLHQLPHLAAGESVTLSGEFKLPLSAITPIRSGNAALFIPLARFRVEASRKGAPPLVANSAFVIGENQERPGAALKPFRLDLGPRLYSQIGQRELAMSA